MVVTFLIRLLRKIFVGISVGFSFPYLFILVFALYNYVADFSGQESMELYGLGFISVFLGGIFMTIGIIGSLLIECIWEWRNIQLSYGYEIAHVFLFVFGAALVFFHIFPLLVGVVTAIIWLVLERVIIWLGNWLREKV